MLQALQQVSFSFKNDNRFTRNLTAPVARILFVIVHTIYITAIWNILIHAEAHYLENLYIPNHCNSGNNQTHAMQYGMAFLTHFMYCKSSVRFIVSHKLCYNYTGILFLNPHTNCNQNSTSEEQSPHASSHSLPVIQDVKFVYKLIDIIAAFGDCSQVCHEAHIIALL